MAFNTIGRPTRLAYKALDQLTTRTAEHAGRIVIGCAQRGLFAMTSSNMTSSDGTSTQMAPREMTASHLAAADDRTHEAFLTALQMQDALGALLRTHFQLEAGVLRALEQRVPRAQELPPLTYEHKLRLTVALGMHVRIVPALLMVGQLHEQAGRCMHAGLDDAAVDQLFGVLAKPEREAVLAWHERTRAAGVWHEAPALQRFNLIATVLHAALLERVPARSSQPPGVEPDEVVTFEWSAPAPPPRARDFASKEALYSWLIASD
jgi:hypothetical protein